MCQFFPYWMRLLIYIVKDQLFPYWLRLIICTLSRISSFLIDWDCSYVHCQGSALSILTKISRCLYVHHHPYPTGHYWTGIYPVRRWAEMYPTSAPCWHLFLCLLGLRASPSLSLGRDEVGLSAYKWVGISPTDYPYNSLLYI